LPLWSGPWNSISHSWEEFPGNYTSRFVVGFACDMIAVFHAMLYAANTLAAREPSTTTTHPRCCQCYTNEVLLGLGLLACFCLTWVGAICDAESDPQCMGNNTIHSTCAVLFFALTDVICGVMACGRSAAGRSPRARSALGAVCVGLALTTAVRACRLASEAGWTNHPHYQHGDNATILAEVAEVALFITFLNTVASEWLQGLNWAAATDTANPGTGQVSKPAVAARTLAHLASGLVLFTVSAAYVCALKEGTAPPPWRGLPELGSLFTSKPGNWIGRWGFVQASSALLWVALFAQTAASGGGSWAAADKALFGVQVVAALALAGMGIVNEFEDASAHRACTNVFFACADVAALGMVALQTYRAAAAAGNGAATSAGLEPPGDRASGAAVAAVAAAVSTLRFSSVLGLGAPTEAALEWANLLALAAFWSLNATQRPATAAMGLVILVDGQTAGGALAKAPHATASAAAGYAAAHKTVAQAERGISLL
jgi:hypothetical protein